MYQIAQIFTAGKCLAQHGWIGMGKDAAGGICDGHVQKCILTAGPGFQKGIHRRIGFQQINQDGVHLLGIIQVDPGIAQIYLQ